MNFSRFHAQTEQQKSKDNEYKIQILANMVHEGNIFYDMYDQQLYIKHINQRVINTLYSGFDHMVITHFTLALIIWYNNTLYSGFDHMV